MLLFSKNDYFYNHEQTIDTYGYSVCGDKCHGTHASDIER